MHAYIFYCIACLLRLQELRADLNETKQSRNQLEQVTYALSEELRTLRNKVEGQQAEFVSMVTDVRNRARKLEDENRIHVRLLNSLFLTLTEICHSYSFLYVFMNEHTIIVAIYPPMVLTEIDH